MNAALVYDLLIVTGFLMLVVGLALWSFPAALVVAGVILMLTGGAGYRSAS